MNSSQTKRADKNSSLRKTFQSTVVGLSPAIWFLQSINSSELLKKSLIEKITAAKIKLTNNVQSQNLHSLSWNCAVWTVATATESQSPLGRKQKLVTCLDKTCASTTERSKQTHCSRSANKELFSKLFQRRESIFIKNNKMLPTS